MICSRRHLTAASVLGLATIFTCAQLWGDPKRSSKEKDLENWRSSDKMQHALPADLHFTDEVAKSRFAEQPVLTYRNLAGETLFALQIKPALRADASSRAMSSVIETASPLSCMARSSSTLASSSATGFSKSR